MSEWLSGWSDRLSVNSVEHPPRGQASAILAFMGVAPCGGQALMKL